MKQIFQIFITFAGLFSLICQLFNISITSLKKKNPPVSLRKRLSNISIISVLTIAALYISVKSNSDEVSTEGSILTENDTSGNAIVNNVDTVDTLMVLQPPKDKLLVVATFNEKYNLQFSQNLGITIQNKLNVQGISYVDATDTVCANSITNGNMECLRIREELSKIKYLLVIKGDEKSLADNRPQHAGFFLADGTYYVVLYDLENNNIRASFTSPLSDHGFTEDEAIDKIRQRLIEDLKIKISIL